MDEKEIERQEKNGRIVENNVFCNQSMLVEKLISEGVFNLDDVENLYLSDEQIKDYFSVETEEEMEEIRDNGEGTQEIYEWWVVSDYMADKLKNLGEPVLENDYGTWWGRTCTGQAIKLDSVIDKMRNN